MSKQKNMMIACPKCRQQMGVTVWENVDTNLTPDLPQLIISGEFFIHSCPQCGAKIQMEMPMLYNDINHRAMVWLLEPTADVGDAVVKLMETPLGDELGSCRTRCVRSNKALQEKVCMLEACRDDRVVEVVKYLEYQDFCMKNSGENIAGVRYAYRNGAESLVYFNAEGAEHEEPFRSGIYDQWEGYLQSILGSINVPEFAQIDARYAENLLYGYFGQMVQDARARSISVLQLMSEGAVPVDTGAGEGKGKKKEKKEKKKGGRAILWIILALVTLLIAVGAFVIVKYNALGWRATGMAQIEEVIESEIDLGDIGVLDKNDVHSFLD